MGSGAIKKIWRDIIFTIESVIPGWFFLVSAGPAHYFIIPATQSPSTTYEKPPPH
jgi:hypothetical protein